MISRIAASRLRPRVRMSPPSRIAMASPMAVLAVHAEDGLRRIGVAAADRGDVAQADHAPVRDEVDVQDVLFRVEAARDPQRELLVAGLDDARRQDHVLRPERATKADWSSPRPASCLVENSMKMVSSCAPSISILTNVRHAQQPRADVLGVVAQLAMRETVGGEAVDDAERVAELVVEERARPRRAAGCGACRRRSCARGTRCRRPPWPWSRRSG